GASFVYFAPKPMPRSLELSLDTIMALSAADNALGRLASAGKYLKDPALFVRPYMTREAVASSRIEGTEASLSDVLQAEAVGEPRDDNDIREVQNYVAAFDHGLQRLSELPVSQRFMSELHEILMRGVRGRDKRPGELRDIPVYVGSPTDSAETALFVPPLSPALPGLLDDWERFANEPPKLPILIQCALLHYQFETIHPYMDGNGRLGRLMIVLYLRERGLLPAPLLYVSAYLEENRREYYDRLQAVRERGEVNEWIQFFLTAVTAQSQDAVEGAESLFELHESYRAQLAGSRSRAREVVDMLFENPFVTARLVSERLSVTTQGALNLIRVLEGKQWLSEIGTLGRGGRVYWFAPEIFGILERPRRVGRPAGERQLTLGAA
ncbi:MAG: Fic family protein, partial [Solirubrobacterales bacterium]|nr:Fic family protein [Solirubrobacterales bacterium]